MALECRADGCHRAEFVDGYCEDHLAEKLASIREGGEIDGVRFAGAGTREEPEVEPSTQVVAAARTRRPSGYWTFETAVLAYSEVAEKIGHAPGWDQMVAHGQSSAVTGRSWKLHELREAWERQKSDAVATESPVLEPTPPLALVEESDQDPAAEMITEVIGLIAMMASLNRVTEIELVYDDDTTRTIDPSLFRRLLREELGRVDLEDIGEATLRHLDGDGVDLRSVR